MTMISRRWMMLPVATLGAAMVMLNAFGQAPAAKKDATPAGKPDYGVIHLSTAIGSFKMLEYNDDKQPEGKFEMSFSGTVLIDTAEAVKNPRGLSTKVTTTGDIRKEQSFHGREVYHGTGKIIIEGGWHAIEWFGRDMQAVFNGVGVFRLAGEFDKHLETGYYWYEDGKKIDWGTQGGQPTVPKLNYGPGKATVKINGKGG